MDQRKKAKLMGLRPYVHGLDFFIINKKNNLLTIFLLKKNAWWRAQFPTIGKVIWKFGWDFLDLKNYFVIYFYLKKSIKHPYNVNKPINHFKTPKTLSKIQNQIKKKSHILTSIYVFQPDEGQRILQRNLFCWIEPLI
jgi:hypothetical protein